MARGWESKSVESQMESLERRRPRPALPDPDQLRKSQERESLLLSRTRVLRDLEAATNPRYRMTLEAALKHLDEKLAALEQAR
jgi:hypothetical protein